MESFMIYRKLDILNFLRNAWNLFCSALCSILFGLNMPSRLPRMSDNCLDKSQISEGYVLIGEDGKNIVICVCVNGEWISFPYTEELNNELGELLKDKFTSLYLHAMVEMQKKYEIFANTFQSEINSARTNKP
jgi:hypothetical protein